MLLRVKMAPAALATDTRFHEPFIKVSPRIQAENPRLWPTSRQPSRVRRKRRCADTQLRPDDTAFLH